MLIVYDSLPFLRPVYIEIARGLNRLTGLRHVQVKDLSLPIDPMPPESVLLTLQSKAAKTLLGDRGKSSRIPHPRRSCATRCCPSSSAGELRVMDA